MVGSVEKRGDRNDIQLCGSKKSDKKVMWLKK